MSSSNTKTIRCGCGNEITDRPLATQEDADSARVACPTCRVEIDAENERLGVTFTWGPLEGDVEHKGTLCKACSEEHGEDCYHVDPRECALVPCSHDDVGFDGLCSWCGIKQTECERKGHKGPQYGHDCVDCEREWHDDEGKDRPSKGDRVRLQFMGGGGVWDGNVVQSGKAMIVVENWNGLKWILNSKGHAHAVESGWINRDGGGEVLLWVIRKGGA